MFSLPCSPSAGQTPTPHIVSHIDKVSLYPEPPASPSWPHPQLTAHPKHHKTFEKLLSGKQGDLCLNMQGHKVSYIPYDVRKVAYRSCKMYESHSLSQLSIPCCVLLFPYVVLIQSVTEQPRLCGTFPP